MYADQKIEVPPDLELFLAQELAIALVAKDIGFTLEEFGVEWQGESRKLRPRALSSVSAFQFLTSDAPEQRRAYVEKRIAVLCARACAVQCKGRCRYFCLQFGCRPIMARITIIAMIGLLRGICASAARQGPRLFTCCPAFWIGRASA
ncbi:hypothetical protein LJR129_004154 [Acidovorax sp. LjRoot129]|uniref:hypothetical protein n=1 Tax=Acidovorax sp. LjRoot129 TaxID=3342260 RepID=UPI003ED0481A